MTMASSTFPTWAIVEVMGHGLFAGFVSEEILAGAAFIRVDVPETDRVLPFSKLLGAGSIFGITPCTEEAARAAAKRAYAQPCHVLDVSKPPAIDTRSLADPWKNYDDEDDREDFGEEDGNAID